MKRRSLLIPLAAALVITALVAGCGGGGDTTTTAAPETTLSPDTTGVSTTGGAADGAAIFATNCSVCHGAQGQGGTGPDLRPLGDADRDRVVQQVINGGSAMPSFGGSLSAAEIDAVAAYVLTLQ